VIGRAALLTILGLGLLAPVASAQGSPPTPEPGSVLQSTRPCKLDTSDPYEKKFYENEGWKGPDYERYPGACERLKFAYGPLVVKPGQNDVLVGPVTIEKPNRDGYITRFKPNLVRADGTVPPVEQVHLHHGTWLSEPSYGSGPFFAAGEEKTIAPFPRGYGMPIHATDQWQLLYMVHSAVSDPMEVYITYEIDFVPKAKGDKAGIKPAYPLWLDVRPSGYPVFNVQRGFGDGGRCTWPSQQCARFDPYGKKIVGQGQQGNGHGQDFTLPSLDQSLGAISKFTGGTLIGIGGHLHPGGIQNDIDLVRPGGATVHVHEPYTVRVRKRQPCTQRRGHTCLQRAQAACARRAPQHITMAGKLAAGRCLKRKLAYVTRTLYHDYDKHVDSTRIYNGRAHYWSHTDPTKDGGPPTSWDFSMEVQGLPRWGVHIKPGDILRSNATYNTEIAASYEDMGIAVALIAPDSPDGKPTAPEVDPFSATWTTADGPWSTADDCGPAHGNLCETGAVTHGHYKENGNYGGPNGDWSAKPGPTTNNIAIADFQYTPGDLTTKATTGIPEVPLGSDLQFTNVEGAGIYHTITTCAFPCLGQTGAAFPLPNGKTSTGRAVDLDSAELGYGAPAVGAASQTLNWTVPVTPQAGFQGGEIVTYYCRIHPFMRGAFEVSNR
jgi:hypothetical protein